MDLPHWRHMGFGCSGACRLWSPSMDESTGRRQRRQSKNGSPFFTRTRGMKNRLK
jgi:hypothetical protein